MSTEPQESIPDGHSHTHGTPLGAAQTALTSPGSPAQPPSSPVVEKTTKPSAPTNVLGAAYTRPPLPASSSLYQATLISKPVPEVPPEHLTETGVAAEVPGPVAFPTFQAPTADSTQGGGRARANTLPRKPVLVTRSHPTQDSAPQAPRTIIIPHDDLFRRPTRRSGYRDPDSETIWHIGDDTEPSHESNIRQRLLPTINAAKEELFKARRRARLIALALNILLTLEVLIGALTTALGAALSGNVTRIAISILGVSSTLVASYLARTRGSDEPGESRLRARELEHFLREVKSFSQDHGHEVGSKWDDQLNDFRLSLERILGYYRRRSMTVTDPLSDADSNTGRENGKWTGSDDRVTSSSSLRGNSLTGRRPVNVRRRATSHPTQPMDV